MADQPQGPDFAAIKERQRQTWASGDFAMVASHVTIVGELLCEAVDLRPGQQVLDVATGSGNTALAAARRFCDVTGADYVPALLERARERATAERLQITFREGDAESLPFAAESFDIVLSTFGVMFAPNQEQAASELLRVCRPGGRIGLSSWTPDGFIGEIFRATARHVPPPPGLKPVFRWGTEQGLRELFGDRISSLECARRSFVYRYRSPQHWLEFFRTYYGPTLRAFEALAASGQETLARDLTEVLKRFDRSGGDMLKVPSDYLEVVATRR